MELFLGSGAIILAKRRGVCEIANDLDGNCVNFFKVLRDTDNRNALIDMMQLSPSSRDWHSETYERYHAGEWKDDIERAWMWWYLCNTTLCAAAGTNAWGRNINKSPKEAGEDRGINTRGGIHNRRRDPHNMIRISERFRNVQLENRCAIKLLKDVNDPNVFVYADPPYDNTTRSVKYMTDVNQDFHRQFVNACLETSCMMVVSGYESPEYKRLEDAGWRRGSARCGAWYDREKTEQAHRSALDQRQRWRAHIRQTPVGNSDIYKVVPHFATPKNAAQYLPPPEIQPERIKTHTAELVAKLAEVYSSDDIAWIFGGVAFQLQNPEHILNMVWDHPDICPHLKDRLHYYERMGIIKRGDDGEMHIVDNE